MVKKNSEANIRLLDGNQAAAEGAKLSAVQVIAAYPITPQTPLTEELSEFVERGKLKAEYIAVEREHSAMTVCISASLVGTRKFWIISSRLIRLRKQGTCPSWSASMAMSCPTPKCRWTCRHKKMWINF